MATDWQRAPNNLLYEQLPILLLVVSECLVPHKLVHYNIHVLIHVFVLLLADSTTLAHLC